MRIFSLFCLWIGICTGALCADLSVRVVNDADVPLSDAVVFATGAAAAKTAPAPRPRAIILQKDRVFQPFVTVVQRGTAVGFPNEDPFMHHVYSFSPAKRFEIKLYRGTPETPVVFDKAGVVVLGCNVHDWMIAYVLVVETPVFEKSGKDGLVRFRNLVAGRHQFMVWYPGMREPVALQEIVLAEAESRSIEHRLKTAVKRPPPAPPFDPLRYSFLQRAGSNPLDDVCTPSGS